MVSGQPSEAQISPNSTEVILKYNPKQPIINHLQSINIPLESKIMTMRAIDSRNIAIGTKNGDVSLIDIEGNFTKFLQSFDIEPTNKGPYLTLSHRTNRQQNEKKLPSEVDSPRHHHP